MKRKNMLWFSVSCLVIALLIGICNKTDKNKGGVSVMQENTSATENRGADFEEDTQEEAGVKVRESINESEKAMETSVEETVDESEEGMEASVEETAAEAQENIKASVKEAAENESKQNEEESEQEEDEYTHFAIANVDNYVNVRNQPSTEGEIVGKIYDGAVAEILKIAGENNDWFQIVSGNVEGYIKAEFFIYGEDAAEVMDQYVTRYAVVKADRLNVRSRQSREGIRIGYIDNGEKVKISEDCGEWLKVWYTEQEEGYVSAEYVTVSEEYTYARTLEEEQAELEARRALEERSLVAEADMPEAITDIEFPAATYTSNEELRKEIVSYAIQFVGNKYVSGGSSLATGTDCSGFTCFVYADFGYSISRTPAGQYSGAGRSIDYSEIQPGDIICYSSNGRKSCTHVALYIGNGQIVHAANSRKGVIIGEADYDTIIGIRNVID